MIKSVCQVYITTFFKCYCSNTGPEWYAILGATNIAYGDFEGGIKILYDLRGFHIHQNYKRGEKYFDAAVIRLREPAKLEERINTICLPPVRRRINLYRLCDLVNNKII